MEGGPGPDVGEDLALGDVGRLRCGPRDRRVLSEGHGRPVRSVTPSETSASILVAGPTPRPDSGRRGRRVVSTPPSTTTDRTTFRRVRWRGGIELNGQDVGSTSGKLR